VEGCCGLANEREGVGRRKTFVASVELPARPRRGQAKGEK